MSSATCGMKPIVSMSNCNHSAWLHLSGSPESVIHNEDQLHRILSELVNPSRQQPSLILFVGPQDKEYALRDMFPLNNFTKHTRRHSGTVNLRVDTTTLRSDHPILFADSNPQRPSSVPPPDSHCHEITSHLLTGKAATSATAYNLLHARLLCLFADVVCLFGNGSWNEEDIIERLQSWAATGVPSQTPNMIKPRVIIVLRGDDASPTFNLLQLEDLQFNLRHRALRECFSSITVLRLADEQVSSVSRYRPLKELILRHVDEMRYLRRSFRCLFSANHLNSLFHAALYHLAATTDEPFDALVMSRVRNPVGLRLHNHLSNFLQLCTTSNVPQVTALSIMASSILLDAYPPRMHGSSSCFHW